MAAIGKSSTVEDHQLLDPEGNLYEGRLGAHRGDYEGLNVRNPQPGFQYIQARWLDHRGKPDMKRVMHFRNLGYEFPQEGEALGQPESLHRGTNLEARDDITFGDLVLMRCPDWKVMERKAERQKRSDDAIMGGYDDFVARGRGSEEAYGGPDKPIRFKVPGGGHGIKRRGAPDE